MGSPWRAFFKESLHVLLLSANSFLPAAAQELLQIHTIVRPNTLSNCGRGIKVWSFLLSHFKLELPKMIGWGCWLWPTICYSLCPVLLPLPRHIPRAQSIKILSTTLPPSLLPRESKLCHQQSFITSLVFKNVCYKELPRMRLSTSATPLMNCGSFLKTAWRKQGQARHLGQNLRAHITGQAVSHGGQNQL